MNGRELLDAISEVAAIPDPPDLAAGWEEFNRLHRLALRTIRDATRPGVPPAAAVAMLRHHRQCHPIPWSRP